VIGGRVLVTFLLVLAVVFGALTVVSVGVGMARHGDSLMYGDSLTVPVELSPEVVGLPNEGSRLAACRSLAARIAQRQPRRERSDDKANAS
jgi:hypothetical protein